MRYVWDQFDAYFGPERLGRWPSAVARQVAAGLARWDRDTSTRVDRFIANSRHVAGRIARYYNRRASVVHAPVDTDFYSVGADEPEDWFLVVSALVPYKRIDVAIRAAAMTGRAAEDRRHAVPTSARLRKHGGTGRGISRVRGRCQSLRQMYRRASAP